MRAMDVTDRVGLDPHTLDAIVATVTPHTTLERVVAWGLAQPDARWIHDVVVQDEYTHDVVMRWRERLVLVYDTT